MVAMPGCRRRIWTGTGSRGSSSSPCLSGSPPRRPHPDGTSWSRLLEVRRSEVGACEPALDALVQPPLRGVPRGERLAAGAEALLDASAPRPSDKLGMSRPRILVHLAEEVLAVD